MCTHIRHMYIYAYDMYMTNDTRTYTYMWRLKSDVIVLLCNRQRGRVVVFYYDVRVM